MQDPFSQFVPLFRKRPGEHQATLIMDSNLYLKPNNQC